MCGTRGSSYKRSREFSEYYRTNLRDYPLADNRYMLEQLIKRHSFIDPGRIGIWGGSSGGFMAASAILQYPDFYKVSVARAGQHEPAIFHSWWSDFFNTPIGKTEADTLYSNISIAKNLEGRLFIIHGEADMNVHPSNSARLANELMKQGKYFDYLVVPGGGHGWSSNGLYVQKRIWLYFIEHLMDYKLEDIDIMQ
jgi:dipeptidyl aminopeptidase/acylaminoacyl peptidase